MKKNTIVILGDSTSMTIGAEAQMYPFHLAEMPVWAPETKIVNCSLPGFTSFDASAFFFRNIKSFENLSAVIIYLGNCDTMASELDCGRYSRVRDGIYMRFKRWAGLKNPRARLKNKLLHFEWNPAFDQEIELPITVSDFEDNISQVVDYCRSSDVPVILVRPEAHVHFPSGAGKGNFSFYHYLDIDAKISERIKIADPRFKNAMSEYESGHYEEAANIYKDILLHPSKAFLGLEYQLAVVHNYAVSVIRKGDIDEGRYLLNLLLQERGVRREIVLYNLAMIEHSHGDTDAPSILLQESYEADKSMYRVRDPYKQAVDRIGNRYSNTSVIDLREFLSDNCFVDHCHPLPVHQKKIADAVREHLSSEALRGNSKLEIENRLYNPEYGLGNQDEFHDYFRSFSDLGEKRIAEEIERMKDFFFGDKDKRKERGAEESLFETLPKEIKTAFEYYRNHPCFPDPCFALAAGRFYPSDVGRFPEYFIVRFMFPFIKKFENDPEMATWFSEDTSVLRASSDMLRILPDQAREWVSNDTPEIDDDLAQEWVDAILDSSFKKIKCHLEKGNQIGVRLLSTIFWYFRESLRFGTHSRVSMRYERVTLEYIAESLAVAGILDRKTGGHRESHIRNLIMVLEQAVSLHENYCSQYDPALPSKEVLKKYDEELTYLAKALNASQAPMALEHRSSSFK